MLNSTQIKLKWHFALQLNIHQTKIIMFDKK